MIGSQRHVELQPPTTIEDVNIVRSTIGRNRVREGKSLMASCSHDWITTFDAEGDIIGRVCSKCGTIEGRLS